MVDISCEMKTIKVLLMVFNFIFIIVGFAILGVGITIVVFFQKFVAVTGAGILVTPIIVVVVGSMIVIVAMLGFCGTVKEDASLVKGYSCVLGFLLVAQLACSIALFILRHKVEKMLRKDLHEKMKHGYNATGGVVHDAIDFIQEQFHCCGVGKSGDWERWGITTPTSCCKEKNCDVFSPNQIYNKGCVDTVKEKMKEKILMIAGVAVLVCVVELLCICFGCCLAKAIKGAYEPV